MAKKRPSGERSPEQNSATPSSSDANLPFALDLGVLSRYHGRAVDDEVYGEQHHEPQKIVPFGSPNGIASDTRLLLTLDEQGGIRSDVIAGRFATIAGTAIKRLVASDKHFKLQLSDFLKIISSSTAFLFGIQMGGRPPEEDSVETAVYDTLGKLSCIDLRSIALSYLKHGQWTFCPDETFCEFVELILIPWHRLRVDNIVNKCRITQDKLAARDADRSALLEQQVAPVLNEAEELLRTASLPKLEQSELRQLVEQLRSDAYYRDIIDTDEAAEILQIDPSRVRKLAKQGLLGTSFARTYVFHRSDVERFAQVNRPPGNPSQRQNRN